MSMSVSVDVDVSYFCVCVCQVCVPRVVCCRVYVSGVLQGFRSTFNASKAVWSINQTGGKCTILDQLYDAPNGILLSPDERTCYVSDVWNEAWRADCPGDTCVQLQRRQTQTTEAKKVMQYDVQVDGNGISLTNRRLFFDLDGASLVGASLGYPDGLKADAAGNVYAGCGDGVRVYNPAGKFLGVFAVEGGVSNLVFGGEDGRTLVMLNETRAIAVTMAVTGALS